MSTPDRSAEHATPQTPGGDPAFYVAASRKSGLSPAELAEIGRWLDARPHMRRPWPVDAPGLVFNANAVRLFAPGRKPAAWHPGMAHWRLRRGTDALPEALGVEPGAVVVDGTLGMGHDALLLAAAGAQVVGLERRPALIYYTLCGIYGYRRDLSRGIAAVRADHADWLAAAADDSVDHVYLDPMFPADRAGSSVTWTTLRTVARPGPRVSLEVLRDAVRVARRTVGMKLAPGEPPPAGPGLPPARIDGSKRLHFAVWDASG